MIDTDLFTPTTIRRFTGHVNGAVYGAPDRVPISEGDPKQPINPYGASKLMTEQMLSDTSAAFPINYGALRYFNVSGADPEGRAGQIGRGSTHLIKVATEAASGKRDHVDVFGDYYPTPDGTCIRDYIHVDDLAEAHILALEKLTDGAGLQYNVGTGRGYSVREVIRTAEAVTGKKVPVVEGPRRPGDPPELVASPAKVMRELGWKPKYIELEQIIETAWKWHRSHPKGYRG